MCSSDLVRGGGWDAVARAGGVDRGGGRDVPRGGRSAFGDVDGDGRPDVCALAGEHVLVVSADGELLLDDPTGMDLAWVSGGCAMADLDADGHQEVVAYGMWGLRLYDLDTGESSRWEDGSAGSVRSAPTIADVDDEIGRAHV